MRRLGNPAFGRYFPSKRYKGLLIFLSRQHGAAGSDIGERTDGGRLGQKHFSENCTIVWLHPEVPIDLQSTTEDNLIIIITRNSRARCRK